ncbi:serine hydrolase domain-containing protein [Streptomyces sp. NPDC056049]|uniref:serine hydrolase domain-containing protein n=1 Tax=Streptomyces sp. NPDC056049 TaxID=3345693 RepID=UPI0035DCC401
MGTRAGRRAEWRDGGRTLRGGWWLGRAAACWAAVLAAGIGTASAAMAEGLPAESAFVVRGADDRGADGRGRWSDMDAFVRERMAATGTPGGAWAVVEGGAVVHEQAYGRDGRGAAVTPDTPFLWGSLAKPVTALAVMQLVEDGRVRLDAPARTYLPWFRLADREVSDRITVRHLLTNTSGIPASATAEVQDRYDNAPGALAHAVRDLARIEPGAEPGTAYAYSSAGYAVLGALVEEVSGESYGAYAHERILGPLGMEHAIATEDDAERERLAPGHRPVFGRPTVFDAPYDTAGAPAAHVGGSVGDAARLVLAQLGGGEVDGRRVLSARGIAEMHRGQADSDIDRFGLGWSVGTLPGTGERTVWKSGSLPGYDAMIIMLPESDRAVIVLQNAFDLLRAQEFHHAAVGAARILSGAEPGAASADPLATVLPWSAAALAVLLTLCAAAPALRILPGRRAAARARSRRRILWTTAVSAGTSLALVALLWWVLPASLGGTLASALLWLPDTGWSAVAVIAAALFLAVERLALAAVDLRHGRAVGSQALTLTSRPR